LTQEIERKFLIGEAPSWLGDHPAKELRQGYVVLADDTEVRLRTADGARLLTVKRGRGEVRCEEEIELDAAQFEALWPLTESLRVSKRRYRVPLEGTDLTAEVDVFAGDLEGLVVVEVEFPTQDQSRAFQPPSWFGREVTGDVRYSTAELARAGLPREV
jgi:adenylate cyclase